MWNKQAGLGKAALNHPDISLRHKHRSVFLSFDHLHVGSIYGPADKPDTEWVNEIFRSSCTQEDKHQVFIGDYNWKPTYDKFVPKSWCLSYSQVTTFKDTAPTRGVSSAKLGQVHASALPGIKTHLAITFEVEIFVSDAPATQAQRLRRCAIYEWQNEWLHPQQLNELLLAVDEVVPKASASSPLDSRWDNWHRRTECAFQKAVSLGFAKQIRKAERIKGSIPTSRSCGQAAKHREQQTVIHRRLLRVHRALSERCRQGESLQTAVSGTLLTRTCRVVLDASERSVAAFTFGSALATLNDLILQEEKFLRQRTSKDWRAHFRTFTKDIWGPAKGVLKTPKMPAAFNANDLRDEWAKHWCPPDTSKASEAVANWAKWTAKEIIALQHHLTPLADELYQLWIDTPNSSNEDLPKSLIRKIWNWKVVGITKKSIFDSRPISIASLLVRAWRKALLKNCPAAPTGQWCGRAKTSVVDATADFVAARPIHVAETDLTKAFDHLWPSLAEHAMIHNGVPPIIAKTLHRAWLGPRICTVGGLLAIEINPARGVPQGDPCSPLALSACLGVWTQIIEKIHPCLKMLAYMDDRTIAVVRQGTKNHLESALEATKDFDKKVGFQINPEKTQIWIKNESTGPIEHLGLTFDPARPAPLGVRDPTKKEEAVARLHRCPGSCEVRAKLTTAFVRPLFDWASPLLPPGTIQEATNLFQAIAHSTVSWWCQPRFWAQQIENHPCFGVAIRGLCASYRVLNNKCPHIVKALDRHAKVLHLKIVSFQHDSLTIQSSDDSIVCGTTPGSHPGDFLQSFDLNEGNSQNLFELKHNLQVRARRINSQSNLPHTI